MTKEEAIKILRDTPIDIRSTREDDIHTLYATAQGMAIDALQAEPKRGTWTITYTDDGEGGEIPHLICSECKSEPMAWDSKRFFNYCPNCGAKMDKD